MKLLTTALLLFCLVACPSGKRHREAEAALRPGPAAPMITADASVQFERCEAQSRTQVTELAVCMRGFLIAAPQAASARSDQPACIPQHAGGADSAGICNRYAFRKSDGSILALIHTACIQDLRIEVHSRGIPVEVTGAMVNNQSVTRGLPSSLLERCPECSQNEAPPNTDGLPSTLTDLRALRIDSLRLLISPQDGSQTFGRSYPRRGRCVHCGCRMQLDSDSESRAECQVCRCRKSQEECLH